MLYFLYRGHGKKKFIMTHVEAKRPDSKIELRQIFEAFHSSKEKPSNDRLRQNENWVGV